MSDPHLRVDHRNQMIDLGIAAFWTFDLEAARKVQRLDVMHPNKCDLIVGPLPLHDNIKLVVTGALERPDMTDRHVLDDFERVSTMDFGKRHSSHGNSPHTGSRSRGPGHTSRPLPCRLQ